MVKLPCLDRLHLEVTNVCNFKCEFCPDAVMGRRRGHMDLNLLTKLLDELAEQHYAGQPLTRILTYHLMGEPLIYPPIFTGIQRAVERGLPLHLTTNASTFALFPEHISKLVESGIPKVTLSLQTPDPATYKIRGAPPRLTPELYFEGITRYVQAHLESGSSTRVHIKFLDTTPHPFLVPHKALSVVNGSAAMQQELYTWAERLLDGIPNAPARDQILARIRRHQPGRWQVIPLTSTLALETFPLDSWGNSGSKQIYPAQFGTCNGASRQAGILYDGTVVPCCKDYEGLIPLGSVRDRSLGEVLRAEPACGLRRDFARLKVTNPVCQACIGADSRPKALARQVGSVAYFKLYRPLMQRIQPGWGDV